ncbi:hypothetical protein [Phormidium nigroviride]
MLRIDCETRETALYTIASFYEILPSEIDRFLESFDIEEIQLKKRSSDPHDKMIMMLFEEEFCSPKTGIQEVCWFHLTRTQPTNLFKEGILPLRDALEPVWNTLISIFRDTEHYPNLLALKEQGVRDYQYSLKVQDKLYWGPYAMLIKDIAFQASTVGNYDYLRLPEILEDICNGYLKSFNIRLHEIVVSSLKPCIVKFVSKMYIDRDLFERIIYYLYLTNKGEDLCIDSNRCFDGKGCLIPADDILKIEFL